MSKQFRAWCFTINNFTAREQENLRQLDERHFRYLIWGRETGESGTSHLQGYIELPPERRGKTLQGVKQLLGGRAHVEPRRGPAASAANYCRKDGDFEERGTMSMEPGVRKGFKDFAASASDINTSVEDLARDDPGNFIRYHRGVQEIRRLLCERPRTSKTVCVWLWGATGVGKSRMARELLPHAWWKGPGKWFDGYEGQQWMVWDDYRSGELGYDFLLRMCDEYPLRVEVKGNSREFRPCVCFITAPEAPERYAAIDEDPQQLRRRLEFVVELREGEYDRVRDDLLSKLREFRLRDGSKLPGFDTADGSDMDLNASESDSSSHMSQITCLNEESE